MKKLFMTSVAFATFAISILLFELTSCEKASPQTPASTLTKTEILVAKPWKLDQLHSVIDGVYASYFDGGTNTTGVNYQNLRYTFNADGTGTYVDQFSHSFAITWQFTASNQREMRFTISGRTPDIWQMVEISGNYLHATENFKIGSNTNNLESFRLVQIP
jgi:hypothetical protein